MSIANDFAELLEQAKKKTGAKNDKELCRYLPGKRGGYYMHHFTYRKQLAESPEELAKSLKAHILDVQKPKQLQPAPRAPRNTRRRTGGAAYDLNTVSLSNNQMSELLTYALKNRDMDLEQALLGDLLQLPVERIRQMLIKSIKQDSPSRALFEAFVRKTS